MPATPLKPIRTLLERLDWTSFRKPPAVDDYELTGPAQRWLNSIPAHSRPLLLSRRFPRVANRLAAASRNTASLEACIKELLVDNRGGTRQGFPLSICDELLTLQAYVAQERARTTRRTTELAG